MHIISTANGYVVTDGLTFIKTFLVRAYGTRHACLVAAVSLALLEETVWNGSSRGRIVKKIGVIRERSVGRPYQIEI
jgi:hypothetical protein